LNYLPANICNLLTKQYCLNLCKNSGYSYIGLQSGSSCFCGNNFNVATAKAADPSKCTSLRPGSRCSGDTAQNCGSPDVNNVFQILPDSKTATKSIMHYLISL